MNDFLIYMIKSAVYLGGFYLIYYLFLSRDTLYIRNRFFLLSALLFSLILPAVSINIGKNTMPGNIGKTLSEIIVTANTDNSMETNTTILGAGRFISKIYFAGLFLFGLKLVTDLIILIFLIIRNHDKEDRIIKFKKFNSPGFSSMGYIFLKDSLTSESAAEIIMHEKKHLQHYHFIDIILVETVKVLQWFNPFVYLISLSLRAVHEYQADHECLNSGITIAGYQNHLMNALLNSRAFVAVNAFSNPSLIRKRLIMMTKKRTSDLSNLKIFIVVPVIAFLGLSISSCENNIKEKSGTNVVVKENNSKNVSNVSTGTNNASSVNETSDEVFVVVEEIPSFPGGEKALMDFIYANIQYPETAKKNNIQGTVTIRFCVTSKGTIDKVSVLRGADPSLDEEAMRIVKILPRWQPGKQGGKPVNVWYIIPIKFALQ
ncbi:MAG: TonB family protein [Bacteroidales bacterium]|nr:TonB family protein [Bacteroidales bacterium]